MRKIDKMDGDEVKLLLETFRDFSRRGAQASLFLETRNGETFGTVRVKIPVVRPGEPTSPPGSSRRKSPSTARRNQKRLRTFLERKSSEDSLGRPTPTFSSTPVTGTPSSNQDTPMAPDEVILDKPIIEKQQQTRGLEPELENDEELKENRELNDDEKDKDQMTEKGWFGCKDKKTFLEEFQKIFDRACKEEMSNYATNYVKKNGENGMEF